MGHKTPKVAVTVMSVSLTGLVAMLGGQFAQHASSQDPSRSHRSVMMASANLSPVTLITRISADLPGRIPIGSDVITVPYTVGVPTAKLDDPKVGVTLGSARAQLVGGVTTLGAPGQTLYKGSLTFSSLAIRSLGQGNWTVSYGSASSNSAEGVATPVILKMQSLASERLSRRGNIVRINGSVKDFTDPVTETEGGQFTGPRGRRVEIQRYTSSGWQTIEAVSTDVRGHVDVRLNVPSRVGLRLSTSDTATVFGVVSEARVI